MGLISSDGKSRSQRRAEAKALKKKAKLEAKFESKDRRKADKARRKAEGKLRNKERKADAKIAGKAAKRSAKADRKAAKAQVKVAEAEAKTVAAKAKAAADARPLSPVSVRRYLTVARLVAPIVVPIAYRGAVAARGRITGLQADRAGVSPELLRQYSGHGAPLAARIASARSALAKVSEQDTSSDMTAFVDAIGKRLDNLAIAVDASEAMSPGQRRTAHRAIEDELGAIDADILARLGVRA